MCLEIAFPDIICKTYLKPNSRVLFVVWKMVFIVKLIFISVSYANFKFQEMSSSKRCVAEKIVFAEIIYKALLKPNCRVLSVL